MVYPPPAGGSGRTNTKPKPARQQVAPQTTIRARPAPNTQVQKYSPPPPPVTSTSSGQYTRPNPPPPPRQGNINPPGGPRPGGGPVTNAQPGGGRQEAIQRRRQQQDNNRPKPAGAKAEAGKGGGKTSPVANKLKNVVRNRPKGGGAPAAPVAPAPGPIQPPGLDEFLAGDVNYQSGMSGLMKQLEALKAWKLNEEGNVNTTYNTTKSRMAEERTKALKSLEEDFASRGLLNSGMYVKAGSDYDASYNQQLGDLTTDWQSQLASLLSEYQGGESENNQLLEQLRLDAIRRRAEQYGITG